MRHEALAENIANVNTPGYRRQDVDFHSALQAAMPGGSRRAGRDAARARRSTPPLRCAPTATASTSTPSPPNLAQNALEYEALDPGAPRPRRHPRDRDRASLMGLFDAIDISGSGLSAERLRMDVTAENLANAQSTRGADGQPYRRKEVVLQQAGGDFESALRRGDRRAGAAAAAPAASRSSAIAEDQAPNRLVYDPGHPDANAEGYVSMPNVDPVTEMVDLIAASRAYEANVTAMQTAKTMFTKTLDLLK